MRLCLAVTAGCACAARSGRWGVKVGSDVYKDEDEEESSEVDADCIVHDEWIKGSGEEE